MQCYEKIQRIHWDYLLMQQTTLNCDDLENLIRAYIILDIINNEIPRKKSAPCWWIVDYMTFVKLHIYLSYYLSFYLSFYLSIYLVLLDLLRWWHIRYNYQTAHVPYRIFITLCINVLTKLSQIHHHTHKETLFTNASQWRSIIDKLRNYLTEGGQALFDNLLKHMKCNRL
jgi:hypothetical protein